MRSRRGLSSSLIGSCLTAALLGAMALLGACSRPEPVLPRPADSGVVRDVGVDAARFCSSPCTGDAPFCDEVSATCVECRVADDCAAFAPRVTCEAHACVQCVTDKDCDSPNPHCEEGACVACIDNAECTDRLRAQCGESHQCEPCTADPQCAHLAATPVCDENTGACVACTPDTETTRCGGTSCDPSAFQCTKTILRSLGSCEACVSDSECLASSSGTRRCVPVDYMGSSLSYCLIEKSTAPGEICPPRFAETRSLQSAGGVTAEYCGILANVTCEAIADFRSTCVTDADCGAPSFAADGLCREDGAGSKCTFRCAGDSDCSEGFVCNIGESPPYCRTSS